MVTSNFKRKLEAWIDFLPLLSLLILSSCAGADSRAQMIMQQDSIMMKNDQINAQLSERQFEFQRKNSTSEYKIGPEDLLDIDVFQVPELKTSVRVSASGEINLPLVGEIKAAGLTLSQLQTELEKKLEKKYLEDPVVSVFIKEYRSQRISVLGAVKTPQVFYVTGQKYLLDMISMAGGLTDDAGTTCIVQQSTENPLAEGKPQKYVIDLDELLINGKSELNIPLASGDIIQVQKGGVFYVDGAVRGPGSFPLKGKITLTQAISLAKGLAFEASRGEMKIYRYTGKPKREIITLDYDSILKGKETDLYIKDKDVIIVESNTFKSIFKGISTGLNLGFFSLGKGFGF